jgi:hypothetical protein
VYVERKKEVDDLLELSGILFPIPCLRNLHHPMRLSIFSIAISWRAQAVGAGLFHASAAYARSVEAKEEILESFCSSR